MRGIQAVAQQGRHGAVDRLKQLLDDDSPVASIAFFGHLWQLRDPAGRGLWDRLFGLAVIEDMVPSSMPERLWTPWGT